MNEWMKIVDDNVPPLVQILILLYGALVCLVFGMRRYTEYHSMLVPSMNVKNAYILLFTGASVLAILALLKIKMNFYPTLF